MSVVKQLAIWVAMALGVLAAMAAFYYIGGVLIALIVAALCFKGIFGFIWWGLASNGGLHRQAQRKAAKR